MGRDTSFWEAIVAVAPLLGLTIGLELRQTQWQAYRRGFRTGLMLFLCLLLAGLAVAAANAIHVLHNWNPTVPPDNTEAYVTQVIVQVAILGVLVPPISHTIFVFFGRGAGVIRRLQRAHTRLAKATTRHMADLTLRRQLLEQEVAEIVFANPATVFHATASGFRVAVTSPRIHELRTEAQYLQHQIDRHRLGWRKIEKGHRKFMKRADKQIGMTARGKLVRRAQSFS